MEGEKRSSLFDHSEGISLQGLKITSVYLEQKIDALAKELVETQKHLKDSLKQSLQALDKATSNEEKLEDLEEEIQRLRSAVYSKPSEFKFDDRVEKAKHFLEENEEGTVRDFLRYSFGLGHVDCTDNEYRHAKRALEEASKEKKEAQPRVYVGAE